MEKMQNAIRCIKQLEELLGHNHFMYRTMVDALDAYMNSSVEEAFTGEKALDAYVCEAILECVKHGDHIDVADIKRNIRAEKAREYTLKALEEAGIR